MSISNFMLSGVEHEKTFITSGPGARLHEEPLPLISVFCLVINSNLYRVVPLDVLGR